MTGPIRNTTGERIHDAFVSSPTRSNKTAVEVFVGNAGDISGGSGQANLEVRNATETISALKCVYSVSANSIAVASDSVDFDHASVFGVSITAALTNESTQVQTFGILRDSSFAWSPNTQLYLTSSGSLTDTAPVTGFRTLVAVAQGVGSILINIQEPITL